MELSRSNGWAHTTKDKEKLLNRVNRIKGQVNAIEKALEGDDDFFRVLQTIAACRGAINGLMAEVLEGHARFPAFANARIDPTSLLHRDSPFSAILHTSQARTSTNRAVVGKSSLSGGKYASTSLDLSNCYVSGSRTPCRTDPESYEPRQIRR